MVASFRANIPTGISYEIVIVDAGSTDDTLAWCKVQPDVVLIEHGELRGAIAAFTDGGYAAKGEHVLLGNDDILFKPSSILLALVHLETHPFCGAVAFSDNRPAPGYPAGYKVQTMTRFHDPTVATYGDLIYPQVGLVRKQLGDKIGYWGGRDAIMGKAGSTYGGDTWLGAMIWESGYTVDEVPGAQVDDLVVNDELRQINYKKEPTRSPYYEAFPNGVRIAPRPLVPVSFTPKLRILYLPVYERNNASQHRHKRGLREALARKFLVYEIDWVNTKFDLIEAINVFQPDILLTQVHGSSGILTPSVMARARITRPQMLVVNWNGDVYPDALISPDSLKWLQNVDVQLVVNGDVLVEYQQRGMRAAYWQIGYEPVEQMDADTPAHDVVFLGNCDNVQREELGKVLKSLACNVGIYGQGWSFQPDGNTLYDFAAGAALYDQAKMAIGDSRYAGYGFVSNRVFEALGNGGVFLLQQRVNGLEALLGFADGVHYVAWDNLADLRAKVEYWLDPAQDVERQAIAARGHLFCQTFHTFDARVYELFNRILPQLYEPVRA